MSDIETFDWHRVHKMEDWIENQVDDAVWERVCEHFGVDDPVELSSDQISEIDHFRTEELNEYSVLQCGFSNLINYWESNSDEYEV